MAVVLLLAGSAISFVSLSIPGGAGNQSFPSRAVHTPYFLLASADGWFGLPIHELCSLAAPRANNSLD